MDPASRKRQKNSNGSDGTPVTQSQSSILSHNRSVRLQFLEQFNDLKCWSATKDAKEISMKRLQLLSTLEKLQEVPSRLPYVSPLKSSDARLPGAGENGSNFSSDNIIDLDPDNVGSHSHANVDNTGDDAPMILADSDDEHSVTYLKDKDPSSASQCYIEESLLPEQPVEHQEILMQDNENISSQARAVAKKGKDSMDIDNVFGNESHPEDRGKREVEGDKETIQKDNVSVVDSYEVSCEVIQTVSPSNGNNNEYRNDIAIDELMSVTLRCSKIGDDHSIVPSEKNTFEEETACHHDILIENDLGIACRGCDLIQKCLQNVFECHLKKSDHEEIGEGQQEADNIKIKGTLEKDGTSISDTYDSSCEVIHSESSVNGNRNKYDNDSPVDELEDFWRDMSLAMACSKATGSNHSIVPSETNTCEQAEDDCHHDFLMKDDIGIVCRVCGLIQQRIENVFEYSWKKRQQMYRAYPSEHRISSDLDTIAKPLEAILEVVPDALSIHPQHSQQMKPHQVEGFNFLTKNLMDENNPGGCILAHAPGSGKTFMVISFIQSFLAKHPVGRPLIVLPKGILTTWRTEFLRWQVEPIPLYDFYSSKAQNRSEQLKVLNLWEDNRSILLLGYQQFASIVSDHASDKEALMCRMKLLKVPSLVILDEGHTPRNEHTDLLTSLENIQTPRKVVLSGTLFQNHVKEVFNILKFVRPKFLETMRSRVIVKRTLSKVDMLGKSARSKNIFFDVVEEYLQNGTNGKMRMMMVQNLRELTANVLHYYQGELLEELPGLVDLTVFLKMSSKQEEIIKGLARLKKFGKRSQCNAVSLHPCLKDVKKVDEENSNITYSKIGSIISGININDGVKAKFVHHLLSLSEAAGEKVLVFSQYVRSLLFLEKLVIRMKGWKPEVHTFKVLGSSSQDQREQAVERFNNSSDAKVFFGSIKACGEGISLVGGSRIVILDVHENPAVMRQAIGRAFRPGQSKMVYCYRLVAADSPEEDDHQTAFKKERVSKLWFESNEHCSNDDFELTAVDVSDSKDRFFESLALQQDIKSLYKR